MGQYTDKEISDLIYAMSLILDDMGKNKLGVCLTTKASARLAYEPFLNADEEEAIMPLEDAKAVLKTVGLVHD